MANKQRILKFVRRLQQLVSYLEAQRNLTLHHHVNQFYYMVSIEEFITLFEQVEDFQARMLLTASRLERKYEQTFQQWRHDILWIHRCKQCGVKDRLYRSLPVHPDFYRPME